MRISDWSSDVCSSDLFDSKDAIFRALVRDMSGQVRDRVAPVLATAADQLSAERAGLLEFIEFVRGNQGIYRNIDEAEFVDPVRSDERGGGKASVSPGRSRWALDN